MSKAPLICGINELGKPLDWDSLDDDGRDLGEADHALERRRAPYRGAQLGPAGSHEGKPEEDRIKI